VSGMPKITRHVMVTENNVIVSEIVLLESCSQKYASLATSWMLQKYSFPVVGFDVWSEFYRSDEYLSSVTFSNSFPFVNVFLVRKGVVKFIFCRHDICIFEAG
jgi:hypothetical protein